MPLYDVDRFLNEVCRQIRYKGAHFNIREELQNHILDRIHDYVEDGMDEKTAALKAVKAMGDPIEIGKKLNKLHRPYIGWILSFINTLIVLLGLYSALIVIPNIFMRLEPFGNIPKGEAVKYSIDVNEKGRIDDRIVVIKKLVVDKNNDLYIRYDDYSLPFSFGWSFLDFEVYDDRGNEYHGGGESRGNIFGTRHLMILDKLDQNATKVILNYDNYNRKMRFEIPLGGGDGK